MDGVGFTEAVQMSQLQVEVCSPCERFWRQINVSSVAPACFRYLNIVTAQEGALSTGKGSDSTGRTQLVG
jgi:hypothetical protein